MPPCCSVAEGGSDTDTLGAIIFDWHYKLPTCTTTTIDVHLHRFVQKNTIATVHNFDCPFVGGNLCVFLPTVCFHSYQTRKLELVQHRSLTLRDATKKTQQLLLLMLHLHWQVFSSLCICSTTKTNKAFSHYNAVDISERWTPATSTEEEEEEEEDINSCQLWHKRLAIYWTVRSSVGISAVGCVICCQLL